MFRFEAIMFRFGGNADRKKGQKRKQTLKNYGFVLPSFRRSICSLFHASTHQKRAKKKGDPGVTFFF